MAKLSVDVDWTAVYHGTKEKASEIATEQYTKLKSDIMGNANPTVQRIQANAQKSNGIGAVSATLGQTRAIG